MKAYSVVGLLVRSILWLSVGIGRNGWRQSCELAVLRREIERLKSENEILRKRLRGSAPRRHTWQEKIHILWHVEVFQVP